MESRSVSPQYSFNTFQPPMIYNINSFKSRKPDDSNNPPVQFKTGYHPGYCNPVINAQRQGK